MVAKQLCIFLENKSGCLTEVTEVLALEGINLSALSIAENADFGILRGIVSEPDKACKALKDRKIFCFFVGKSNNHSLKQTSMVAKQLCIFLENKSGCLTEVTEVLALEGINLSALSIAENADFGILRGIVSEPDKACKALKDRHFAVHITDVIGIRCPNLPGSLSRVLRHLSDEGVFIEYMYSFAHGNTCPAPCPESCVICQTKACSSSTCTPLPTATPPTSFSAPTTWTIASAYSPGWK